jgi:hypothetical protein
MPRPNPPSASPSVPPEAVLLRLAWETVANLTRPQPTTNPPPRRRGRRRRGER